MKAIDCPAPVRRTASHRHKEEFHVSPACRRAARPALAAAFLAALAAAGCGAAQHPVDGRVFLNGQPLTNKAGSIVLRPDPAATKDGRVSPFGVLQRDGSYSVATNGRPGAPVGKYKVVVNATEPDANPNEDSPQVLDARYQTEASTPLAVEVVAQPAPGSYDLQLTR
jgi:hypothetical protein